MLVSFANGLAQPLKVGAVTETSNGNVIQIIPDGQVGTISLAGHSLAGLYLQYTTPVL